MSEALVALGAATIGAVAGLSGAFITARQQRRLDELRFLHVRRADDEKERRLAVAELARSLSVVLHTMSWFTWEADNRPTRTTPAALEAYDGAMKAALPDLMAAISVVAALSNRAYRQFDPLVTKAFDLDGQIGKAASRLAEDPDRARQTIGEFKVAAFSLFRQFRDTLAAAMGTQEPER
jgi:hypothetical protein